MLASGRNGRLLRHDRRGVTARVRRGLGRAQRRPLRRRHRRRTRRRQPMLQRGVPSDRR